MADGRLCGAIRSPSGIHGHRRAGGDHYHPPFWQRGERELNQSHDREEIGIECLAPGGNGDVGDPRDGLEGAAVEGESVNAAPVGGAVSYGGGSGGGGGEADEGGGDARRGEGDGGAGDEAQVGGAVVEEVG